MEVTQEVPHDIAKRLAAAGEEDFLCRHDVPIACDRRTDLGPRGSIIRSKQR